MSQEFETINITAVSFTRDLVRDDHVTFQVTLSISSSRLARAGNFFLFLTFYEFRNSIQSQLVMYLSRVTLYVTVT